jgi:hypothetical protein
MKHLLFLFLTLLWFSAQAQSDNALPVRQSYKLSLPVEKNSTYEMDVPATPYVQNQSIVQIYPGETIYLEAEEKDGKLVLTSVREIKDSSKTITVTCTQTVTKGKHENVMLKVTNPFNKSLTYSARMFHMKANKWIATNVLPVQPNLTAFEMWPDVIITFGLSNWQLSSK